MAQSIRIRGGCFNRGYLQSMGIGKPQERVRSPGPQNFGTVTTPGWKGQGRESYQNPEVRELPDST